MQEPLSVLWCGLEFSNMTWKKAAAAGGISKSRTNIKMNLTVEGTVPLYQIELLQRGISQRMRHYVIAWRLPEKVPSPTAPQYQLYKWFYSTVTLYTSPGITKHNALWPARNLGYITIYLILGEIVYTITRTWHSSIMLKSKCRRLHTLLYIDMYFDELQFNGSLLKIQQ